MTSRYVLMIVHNYPPIYGAGAEPAVQFVRHLPEFGYQPIVLTTGRYGQLPEDAAGCVYRAGDLVHSLFAPLRRRRGSVPQAEQYRVATVASAGTLGRLRDRLMVPDTKLGWLPGALRLGRALLDRYHPALLWSTSPPETAHLVAGQLSRGRGLPWVMDLRDGWLFEPPNAGIRGGRLRRRLESRLERAALDRAGAVVAATEPISADLLARYPQKAGRITTITNGYDAAGFAGLARRRRPDGTFWLVHTGSLGASRQGTSADAFFAALARLRQTRPELPLRVSLVGQINPDEQRCAEAYGLGETVSFIPPVSGREAHQYQLDADALLLVTAPGQRSVASLKLFDYVGAGVPILALAEGNAAAEIVARYGLGITAAPDDPQAIAAALLEMMARQGAAANWPGFAAAQRDLEWRTLTGRLAAVFDATLAGEDRSGVTAQS